jgi:hypothetical protein
VTPQPDEWEVFKWSRPADGRQGRDPSGELAGESLAWGAVMVYLPERYQRRQKMIQCEDVVLQHIGFDEPISVLESFVASWLAA